ncbi:MAG: hypothetical protein AB1552_09620 [Nitrospirota bacterium]
MNVFKEIRRYYKQSLARESDIKQVWVEEYFKHIESLGKSSNDLLEIWSDIKAFSFYQDRSEHHDLSKLLYWEYSVCLEWIDSHVLSKEYNLNLPNAKRFLGNLHDFYKFLTEKRYINNYIELEKAYADICGGKKLNLVQRIPYTGKELWTSMSIPIKQGRVEELFTMSDYWLILLYISTKRSWQHLKEVAKNAKSAQKKIIQINNVQKKLKNIGYLQHPERLLMPYGTPTDEDMDDASNWFFHK